MILLKLLIPVLVLGGCIYGDVVFVKFLWSYLPDLTWIFWAKLGIVFVVFWLTAGIVVLLTVISGMLSFLKELTD